MKSATFTKLTRTALAGMMACSMALTAVAATASTGGVIVRAAENKTSTKTTFELRKKAIYDNTTEQNTGSSISEFEALESLGGVTFTPYNVTQWVQDNTSDFDSAEDAVDYLIDHWNELKNSFVALPSDITEEGTGIASFELPTRTTLTNGKSRYSIYLFEETASAHDGSFMRAAPMVVGMSSELEGLDKVILYPKNVGLQKDLYIDNTIMDDFDVYSFEVGQELTYKSTMTVPENILQTYIGEDEKEHYTYQYLSFLDVMTESGTDFGAVTSIMTNDATPIDLLDEFNEFGSAITSNDNGWASSLATVPGFTGEANAGFYYNFKLGDNQLDEETQELLEKMAGKTLTFTYKVTLNESAFEHLDIGNNFYVKYHDGQSDFTVSDGAPVVETSGHDFTKISSADAKVTLAGAEFVLSRNIDGTTEYAKFNYDVSAPADGVYAPSSITWYKLGVGETLTTAQGNGDVSTFTSNASGLVGFRGLAAETLEDDGNGGTKKNPINYTLTETKAPEGYEISANPNTPFTVSLSAVDIPGTTIPGVKTDNITNTPDKSILPVTGANGIIGFLVLGAAAMGGATIYNKKRKA
ncbi:SpaH/EbpB family LPXTG-anchored major pilin [Lacticaseibacillus yichunensis]|uniref:SpaH/EbpB family LPXTG-anchored major pilin n=1 Tax=Lacticaseibacillus yichunensis TaxID=2486015 RepID=A0ABW4CNZ2_9LACO|nr:SpaH/EbpB family LPXTG-anchored major pilin [Lacticaseibacillus yichunensis]